ncbi:A/G-specific adenine glycosylase [Marinicauda pacifica]|uniref:A/G-specific adenine glycosylase n=1 Tax=Marinicauda pacifica TaxID=1133559 RepID=UPI0035C7B9D5
MTTDRLHRDRPAGMHDALLDWYDREGRSLPWRIRPEDRARGVRADPYAIWLSEIMLQQTTVPHATPYWFKFLERWPTVHDLAGADREAVMAAWAGLGYYARARNMHACAIAVSQTLDGVFPSDLDALRALPGIGDYTANAIRAAAFDAPASVVDGNVERVIARVFAIETPLPRAKPEIKTQAAALAGAGPRPGDYAQAIMDLGATVCTPRSPACALCPWRPACAAFAEGRQGELPRKEKKKPKPVRKGVCFHLTRTGPGGEEILLRRRPDSGLLGGMMELPGTTWTEDPPDAEAIRAAAPSDTAWESAGEVRHVFTHFQLELEVRVAHLSGAADAAPGEWVAVKTLGEAGLPSVMMKAARLGS